jgi:hypothetical protein
VPSKDDLIGKNIKFSGDMVKELYLSNPEQMEIIIKENWGKVS